MILAHLHQILRANDSIGRTKRQTMSGYNIARKSSTHFAQAIIEPVKLALNFLLGFHSPTLAAIRKAVFLKGIPRPLAAG